jgi:2-deoxy-D-gluconate 3-dehydrogenase
MQDLFDLSGKKAIVTGSRNGIGQGMAFALARSGADIISFDRNNPIKTREYVESLGRKFSWTQIDLLAATALQLQETVDCVAQEQCIDILINNAGICPRAAIEEYPLEMWEETIKLNLSTVWYLSQATSRHMVAQGGGKIIITGSVLTFQGGLNVPGYAASKHGVAGLAKSLANSLEEKNINSNVLAPGYIETKLTKSIQGLQESIMIAALKHL